MIIPEWPNIRRRSKAIGDGSTMDAAVGSESAEMVTAIRHYLPAGLSSQWTRIRGSRKAFSRSAANVAMM